MSPAPKAQCLAWVGEREEREREGEWIMQRSCPSERPKRSANYLRLLMMIILMLSPFTPPNTAMPKSDIYPAAPTPHLTSPHPTCTTRARRRVNQHLFYFGGASKIYLFFFLLVVSGHTCSLWISNQSGTSLQPLCIQSKVTQITQG